MNVVCAVAEEGMYAFVVCVLQKAVRMLSEGFGTARPYFDSNGLKESDSVGILMLRKEKGYRYANAPPWE